MEEKVAIVCGRRIEHVDLGTVRELISRYEVVVVDLGTGDGRWLYRVARARPEVLCLGVDANIDGLREISHRAARKPARGGVANLRFIAAAVESLPAALREAADELWVMYPWGSLLRAVAAPEPGIVRELASVMKPGGVFRAAINESALREPAVLRRLGLPLRPIPDVYGALRAGYNEAGLNVTSMRSDGVRVRSSWGGRLGQGAGAPTLWVEAVRDANSRDHGGR